MLRLPLETEIEAATAVARKTGLGAVVPKVLHLGNHTTVRLGSLPIAARIASGTSFDFSGGALTREVTLAGELASLQAPTVRPTTTPAPGPYLENGCAVTLWELIDGQPVATQADELNAAQSLQHVHSALASLGPDLPSFIEKVDSCRTILDNRREAPRLAAADRRFLRSAYSALREKLGRIRAPLHPLHGDSHLGNVLVTRDGAIWMDLEAACIGPLEWDVVNLPEPTWSIFPGIDLALMRLLADTRTLCLAVWCWAEFDRSAAAEQTAIDRLRELKARFC